METITININGGYGRNIASTGVINEYCKRNPDKKINIVASFPEVFLNNPHINKVYSINHEYLYDDHIKGTIYLEPEPYTEQEYINGEKHIINCFSKILLKEDLYFKPEIFLTDEELKTAENFVKNQKKVILYNPFGSTGGKIAGSSKEMIEDPTKRSIPLKYAKQIYDELSKDFFVILVKDSSQLGWDGAMTFNTSFRRIMALIPFVQGVVCVDSALNHACASFDKKAVVLWGSTNKSQLGYESSINFGSENKEQYNPVRMPGNDPDALKRYTGVWDWLNESVVEEIIKKCE